MTIDDVKRLIEDDETRMLELKKSTGELKYGMQSVCALLNTDGGWVIFGIAPTSLKIVGQQVTDNTRKEIAHELTKIEPAVDLKVEYVDVPEREGFQVIAIHLPAWPRGTVPYTYDGRPFYRVESTTRIMPRAMFEERMRDSKPHLFAWERLHADSVAIADLDEDLIMNVVRGGVRGGRLSSTAINESKEQLLAKFKLLKDGEPNNAAVALFTQNSYNYPQLLLRMARFRGTDKNEFIDNMQAEGNLFDLFDAGMAFFFKHLNLSGKIEGRKRKEELEIPEVALREALINSLCHRSYEQPGTSVGIAIYDDRVEIENPGCFPAQLTAETILQPHDSFPRNPLIANVLYLSTYLERWGSGVARIIDACRRQGIPSPIYEDKGGFVHIIFRRGTSRIGGVTQNVTQNVTQSVTQNNALTERQKLIVGMLQENSRISLSEVANTLKVSRMTISRELRNINQVMKIAWIGSSKNGHWEIADI